MACHDVRCFVPERWVSGTYLLGGRELLRREGEYPGWEGPTSSEKGNVVSICNSTKGKHTCCLFVRWINDIMFMMKY